MRFLAIALALVSLAGCADHVEVRVCSGHPDCFPDDRDDRKLLPGGPAIVAIPGGGMYLADLALPAIHRLDPFSGRLRVAGTGVAGRSRDGVPAAIAPIGPPELLGLDASDLGLVFRELDTMAVRKIGPDGLLETIEPPPAGTR